jgi:hypothetical protein
VTDIRTKVAYLQGLAEGLELDTGSPEGRVLSSMLDVLVDIAEQVDDVAEAQNELAEYVEDVDYDLGALEESVFGENDDDQIRFVPEEAFLQEDGMELTMCPECGETLAAAAGDIDSDFDVVCPSCGCTVCAEGDHDHDRAIYLD